MKKIDLGQTVSVLANIGVIGGLVFVGLQLAQDREVAKVSALFEATNTNMYWIELVRESPDVWIKGRAGEPLSPAEAAEFERIAASWELMHYTASVAQPVMGIDADKFVREWALELHLHPGLKRWWEDHKKRISYTDPPAPGHINPWFHAVDEELSLLEQGSPRFD